MFAVIKTGGKQYRVAADDVIAVDKVKGEPGEIVEFGEVLLVGGDTVQVGNPTVGGASVAGEVVDQARGPKIIAFKKRRRQNSRRKRGHRQEVTVIRITEILTEGRKPTPRPKAEAGPPPPKAAVVSGGTEEATEATPEKTARKAKAPAKKPAAQPKAAAPKAAKKPAKAAAKTAKPKPASKGSKK
jgi:large subunit ribosomal protein L21